MGGSVDGHQKGANQRKGSGHTRESFKLLRNFFFLSHLFLSPNKEKPLPSILDTQPGCLLACSSFSGHDPLAARSEAAVSTVPVLFGDHRGPGGPAQCSLFHRPRPQFLEPCFSFPISAFSYQHLEHAPCFLLTRRDTDLRSHHCPSALVGSPEPSGSLLWPPVHGRAS